MIEENVHVVYEQGNYSKPTKMVTPNTIHQYTIGKVVQEMSLTHSGQTRIAFNCYVNAGEVVEIGEQRLQYKVVRQGGIYKGKNTYIIVRTDCEEIDAVDFLNAKVGAKVYFMDRFTGRELLDIYLKVHNEL